MDIKKIDLVTVVNVEATFKMVVFKDIIKDYNQIFDFLIFLIKKSKEEEYFK